MPTPLNTSAGSSTVSSSSRSTVDRIVDWTLDVDGDMYGDERERLRWYEGIALGASLQWIVIPWVLAVMAWVGTRETAPYLWVFWAASMVPQYVTLFYVSRKRVDVTNIHWTRKRVVITALTVMPMFVFILGMTVGLDLNSSGNVPTDALVGGAVGATVGGAAAALAVRAKRRKDAARLAAADSDESSL